MRKFLRYLILVKILVFINTFVWAQTYNTSGTYTWTRPAGVTSIKVECWGAGGGGGIVNNSAGGGGGGGAYAKTDAVVVSNATYTIVVGAGGTADNGTAATNSSFGSDVIAACGVGTSSATGGAGGTTAASTGSTKRAGGNGGNGNGTNDSGGGGGGAAGPDGAGNVGTAGTTIGGDGGKGDGTLGGAGGAGGSTAAGTIGTSNVLGGGGGGGGDDEFAGANGGSPGAGGGGGETGGGAGASGQVIITYTCPTYAINSVTGTTVTMGNSSTVTLSHTTTSNLPTGTYTVTYNLSAPNAATGLTAAMTVSVAGTGTFTTTALANNGATTITITNLSSGSSVAPQTPCSSAMSVSGTITVNCSTFALTSTSAVTPINPGSTSVVTLTNASLTVGSYTVTYNLSAPNAATGLTATMTVAVAGTGTFTTAALANLGTTTLTVTNIAKGTCSNAISSNNTTNIVTSLNYCTATSSGTGSYYFDDFATTGGTGNITNNNTNYSASGYGNFTATKIVTQQQGNSINFSSTLVGYAGGVGVSIFVDWNMDGDFSDTGETVYSPGSYIYTATISGSITVPITASVGSTRMRIRLDYSDSTPSDCGSIVNGEAEDYTFTVTAAPACITPACQPTALTLTPFNQQRINGSFTAGACSPNGYLVVYSTNATLTNPTDYPVDGTTYTVGNTIGDGTVWQADATTTFAPNVLNANTQYYFFIFAYNSACSGGPKYNTTSPLTGNAYTKPATPTGFSCTPVSSTSMSVAFTPAASANVVLVWNSTGTFTNPTDGSAPPVPGSAFCGGTILYNGLTSPYSHTGLTANTAYYYMAYSYNTTTGLYSRLNATSNCTTPCNSSTIPYTESFESITVANTLPSCMATTGVLGTDVYTYIANQATYNRIARTGTDFASFYYGNDDWIFTHPLSLTGGVTYDFSFWYITDGYSGWTTLEAMFGNAQNSGAMTGTITGATISGPNNTTYVQMMGNFTPVTTGTYYCGIHCVSNYTPYYLSIDDINVSAAGNMTYVSSTTTQAVTTTVAPSSTNQQIIGIQVVTSGSASPLSLTSFTLNADATTAISDINGSTAKIYYTGTSSTFATTTLFGSATPTIANYNITGTQALSNGTNYFWLVYDIAAAATIGNYVDAECTSLNVGGAQTPTVTDPAGRRQIDISYCTSTFTDPDDEWISNVTFNTINNTSAANTPTKYGDYTAISTNVTQGSTYALSVTFVSTYTQDVFAWFDWNHDGDFEDAGEEFQLADNISTPKTNTINVTIPITSTISSTRMRIMTYEFDDPTSCQTAAYGETEDYTINIQAAAPCSGTPDAGTATASVATFCGTTSVNLSTTGYTVASGLLFQWQSSPTNSPYVWSDISGATSITYTASITATTYFRFKVTCTNGGGIDYSNILTVTNTAQSINSTNSPVNIACNATASLTATASGGTINWYNVVTGGSSLGTGSPYVTPVITSNTTYYCSTIASGGTGTVGKTSSTLADGYYGSAGTGLVFNALSDFTLISVKVYVQTANSTVNIVLQNSAGTQLNTATFNNVGAGLQTLTLNFAVATGTGYKLLSNNSTYFARDFTGVTFPYTLAGTCSITGGWLSSASTTYYFFYDWTVSTGCESARIPVNIVLTSGVSTPTCAAGPNPANLETAVEAVNVSLNWGAVTDACASATGYNLYFGTDNPPTNIVNGTNLGNVTTYNAGTLTAPTTYYWRIAPYNSAGTNSGCTVWSFTTAPVIVIGTGTNESIEPSPYRGAFDDAREQYLITAAELTAKGLPANSELTSLSFNVSGKNSSAPYKGYTIKMGHTADATFATAAWKVPTWTTVFSSDYSTSAGWNMHSFTDNFIWNGTQNVVIQVCYDNTAATATDEVYYTSAANTVCYAADISNSGCSLDAGDVSSLRPNMKFTYVTQPTGESDVISANNETPNINYTAYQSATINATTDGVRVWSFTIRDGGSDLFDADALPTSISSLSIVKGAGNTVASWSSTIRRAAIFDGATKIADVAVGSESIDFLALTTILAADNSSKTYDLYLTFETDVTDNEQFQFNIKHSSAYVNTTSSAWGSFSALSSIVNDDNRIEVTATTFRFVEQPVDAVVNTNMFPYAEVEAIDLYLNRDLDFNQHIIINSTGTLFGAPKDYTMSAGYVILTSLRHTATAINRMLTITYLSWTVVNSELFDIIALDCAIISNPVSSNGELFICAGTVVDLNGSYSGIGTVKTWLWELGNGSTSDLQNVVDVQYPDTAGYYTTLTVTDTDGNQCKTDLRIMVSGGPQISNLSTGLASCEGYPYTLNVGASSGGAMDVSSYSGIGSVGLSLAETTYLPDIVSEADVYTSSLTYTQFSPDAVLTNENYVTVYAEIEHSYFGDLEVEIKCPNGQSVHLADGYYGTSGNEGVYLGEPIDYEDHETRPGLGYEYRWTMVNPTNINMEDFIPPSHDYTDLPSLITAGTGVAHSHTYTDAEYFPAGTYEPYEAFSNLVGCPLNGEWTIIVTDHLAIDDGFIFEWGLELHESLMPETWNYEATIVSYDWTGLNITEAHPTDYSTTLTPSTGTTNYTITIIDSYGCSTVKTVPLTVADCPGIWQGDVSSDWFTAGNWDGNAVPDGACSGAPDANVNVIIPNVLATNPAYFFPIITGASVAYCDNLTIDASANLSIAADGKLTVCGSVTNNAGATGINILSTSSGTGSLLQSTGAVAATVQRYLSGNAWHLVMPTTDAVPVTDYTGGTSLFYSYNETSADYWSNLYNYGTTGWTSLSSGTASQSQGYFFYDLNTKTATLDGGNLYDADKQFSVTYTTSTGTIADGVTQAWTVFDGWNLIGNPYGCAIDWFYTTGADYAAIENGVYMWDQASSNYIYYMNGGVSYTTIPISINHSDANSRYIPAGQAFFVKAKTSGNITIPKAARVHSAINFHKEETVISDFMRMKIVKNSFSDETAIWMVDGATDAHDGSYDLYKRFSMNTNVPQVYTYNNTGNQFALNSFPVITESKIVPVGVYIGVAGEYTIQFTENTISNVNVYFEDLVLNKMININTVESYTFTSSTGLITNRFVLHFNPNNAPVVINQPENIVVYEDEYFSTTFDNIFEETDLDDNFTVEILKSDESELPEWISNNNLTIEATPSNEQVGIHNMMLKATDLSGGFTYVYFTITVLNVNDAPVVTITPESKSVLEDETFTFSLPEDLFVDIDTDDLLSYTSSLVNGNELPSWITFNSETLTYTGTPSNSEVGQYSLEIEATDLSGLTATTTFNIDVVNVNDEPYQNVIINNFEAVVGEMFTVDLPENTFQDIDLGDALSYTSIFPSWLSFDAVNLIYSGVPIAEGTEHVQLTAKDLSNATANAFFSITVTPSATSIENTVIGFNIYPNPTEGLFVITGNFDQAVNLIVTDITGKEIKHFENISVNNLEIDLTNYASGVYYIEINTDTQTFREKIVKD